ncbi:DNA-binding CsgD family transcriptional regulator [Flavobacterium arsenatis]|uniref:DNA-binding CsgD family transcriptional regulator n=1 Tax=Flavobacterium arsenatis TaxID=1484332 RepID=A0ABU1TPS5_9FLAO|nr:LuxR C-terminal-related transcriptional regulator [Flavobacterium arsenatis]MDR6967812.1 DNA-binding CsgD family transcriptional regulator [Flavobacterium arsenatis]
MGFQISRYNKEIILYGISLALLFVLLRFLEFRFLIISHSFELYVGAIAVLFTVLGIWLAKKLTSPKVEMRIVERFIDGSAFIMNRREAANRKISKRELEVLQLMAQGMSNKEIAESLFVSLNTIKTHSSNLFEKLEAKRRTQAVENAKKLRIIS